MKEIIAKNFEESISVKEQTLAKNEAAILEASEVIADAIKNQKKLLIFGNGGSAADAQHIAAEFIGRYLKERKAFAAIALTTNSSVLTCLPNDYSYDIIFARQVEGLAQPGDVAWGISTSGNSANVIAGIEKAKEMGLKTMTLTGCGGGKLGPLADINMDVPSQSTPRIQEAHLCIYHTICELVENSLTDEDAA